MVSFMNPGSLEDDHVPEVTVKRLTLSRDFIIDCPHCGREHIHGGTGPRAYGHRVAHCASPKPKTSVQGYRIVPPQPWLSLKDLTS